MDNLEQRIRDRVNDAPMETERLLDEAADRLRRYREALEHCAECDPESAMFAAEALRVNDDAQRLLRSQR